MPGRTELHADGAIRCRRVSGGDSDAGFSVDRLFQAGRIAEQTPKTAGPRPKAL